MSPDRPHPTIAFGVGIAGAAALLVAAAVRLLLVGADTLGLAGLGLGFALASVTGWAQFRWQRAHRAHAAAQARELADLRAAAARPAPISVAHEHLRALFDRSALGLLVLDPNDPEVPMRIVDCNEMTCQMHGYTRAELLGHSLRLIDPSYVKPSNTEAFLSGVRTRLRVHGEAIHCRKDGSTFPIEFATCVLQFGDRELVFGMDRDITQRKQAEAALRSSEERWQLAVTGSRDGIWDRDLVTGTGYLSPQWKAMLGYRPEDLGTARDVWTSLIHPGDLAATLAAYHAHLGRHTPVFQHEYRLQHRDGSWRWVLSRGMAQYDAAGRATRIVGVNTDITQHKESEAELQRAKDEAEAANRSKSAFLAVMSHEIRTPMNGVIGFTNLLLDTELSPQQLDWLTTIRSSGESLLTLINDILDFSKIESGRLDLELQPVCVRHALEEVMDLLWSRAREKKLELLYYIEPGVPEWIETDAIRLRQVLVNVLGNAIKFTEHGEVEVNVRHGSGTDGPPHLVFEVRDTGPGIPLDRVSRLFKPFSQADSSTTRRYGGTGLGLAICRSLVRLLGGEIEIVATSPQGTTFRFDIVAPVAASLGHDGADGGFPAQRAALTTLAGKRVLGVDDNEANRRILAATLAEWKIETVMVNSGAAALAWLECGGTADAYLIDYMMPDMDGVQLAEAIKTRLGEATPPLLLLSSAAGAELRDSGAEMFHRVISKPLHQAALVESLLNVLGAVVTVREPARRGTGIPAYDHDLARAHPLRILVAEDNPVNQKLITHLLTRLGYRCDAVGNGLECLEALRSRPYELVLMDCQMPEMDGYEATERIRRGEAGEQHRGVHVIALTAAAMRGDRERSLAVGMNDHLTKPVQAAELITALRGVSLVRHGQE